jgi:hypothetical protein
MEQEQETIQRYSQRSSFMLYAETAIKQGLPMDEVLKKLGEMEQEIQLRLHALSGTLDPRMN